jgi:sialate O-acetylesterase
MVVSFETFGSSLASREGKPLTGFEIAGADGKFVPAGAKIVGETVEVQSERVAAPVAVRYGWADDPVCNLVNREGLPASPFRSDDPALQIKN